MNRSEIYRINEEMLVRTRNELFKQGFRMYVHCLTCGVLSIKFKKENVENIHLTLSLGKIHKGRNPQHQVFPQLGPGVVSQPFYIENYPALQNKAS